MNVCLLGVLPGFRRAGVASQLFSQVINSGRNARWVVMIATWSWRLHVHFFNACMHAWQRRPCTHT